MGLLGVVGVGAFEVVGEMDGEVGCGVVGRE